MNMADIELIIKIPEEVKNRLCFGVTYQKDIQTVCEALNNAITVDDVLGEIRNEIEKRKGEDYLCFDDDDMDIYMIGLNDAIGIIDKYEAKSEDIEMQATEFLVEARGCAESEE